MQELQIVFNENADEINKELTDYLDKNLDEIIYKANVYFKFIIATEKDKLKLKKDGITKLPAIISFDMKPVVGLQNVYKYIKYAMQHKIKPEIKTEDEILQDFMSKEIQDGVSRVKEGNKKKVVIKEEDEDDEFSNDNINRKIQTEQKKRGMSPHEFASSGISNMDEMYTPNRPNNLSMDNEDNDDYNDNDNDEDNDEDRQITSKKKSAANPIIKNDPVNVFNNMADSGSSQDDKMMRSLLEKIGDN